MKAYFKNLNGIRFIAAALVLIHHAFYFTSSFNPQNTIIENCLRNLGRLGVNIFFVLSGFLISYYLIVEKDQTKTINFKRFYIKRILRIWPLYYAIGLPITLLAPWALHKMGLSEALPVSDLVTNMIYLLFFAVNIQFLFAPNRGMFEISWSVCVEEQFYLIWPVLINKFRQRIRLLIFSMFGISILTRLFTYFILPLISHVSFDDILLYNYVLVFTKFDLFTTGLMIALVYCKRDQYAAILKKVFHPAVQWLMLILALLYLTSTVRLANYTQLLFFDNLICCVLFGYGIFAAILENSVLKLENRLLVTLGKVSYGIYLFHTSVGQLILLAFEKIVKHKESYLIYSVIYPLTTLVGVCLLSYISYTWFELRFLLTTSGEGEKRKPKPCFQPKWTVLIKFPDWDLTYFFLIYLNSLKLYPYVHLNGDILFFRRGIIK